MAVMVKMMMMMVNLNEKDDHSKVGWQVQETVGLLEHRRHSCQYFISRKHRTNKKTNKPIRAAVP